MKRHKIIQASLLLSATLTAWCFFMLMRATGPLCDDYWYQRQFVDCSDGNFSNNFHHFRNLGEDYITTWGQALNSCVNHYFYFDNARMANNFRLLSNMIPEWLTDLLSSLMLVILVWAIIRIAGRRASAATWGTVLTLVFLYPSWAFPMTGCDFLMNYLWSSALLLLSYHIITRDCRGTRFGAAVALCLLAGTMHEGLGAATLCGVACYLIQHRSNATRRQWTLAAAMAAGVAFVTFSPALAMRVTTQSVLAQDSTFISMLIRNIIDNQPAPALTLAVLVAVWIKRGWTTLKSLLQEVLPLIIMIAASYAITAFANAQPRALTLANLAFVIISLRGIACAATWSNRRAINALGWTVTLAVGGWLGMLATWQEFINISKEKLLEAVAHTDSDLIYCDLSDSRQLPAIAMRMIGGLGSNNMNEIRNIIGSIRGMERAENSVVLPEKYRGIPFDHWPPVPGNAHLRGSLPLFYSEDGPLDFDDNFLVEFDKPGTDPMASPFSYSPIHQWVKDLRSAASGIDQGVTQAHFIKMPVTDEMKRQGLCNADTVWFYFFFDLPLHNVSRKINAINLR